MTSSERSKKWREDNPDYWVKKNADRRKKYAEDPEHRKFVIRRGALARYKMTPEQFELQLKEQDGHCALCESVGGKKSLCVDHDHKCCTKKFTCGKCRRGILCSECNIRIGALEDMLSEALTPPSPKESSWLSRAMQYLSHWRVIHSAKRMFGTAEYDTATGALFSLSLALNEADAKFHNNMVMTNIAVPKETQ